MLRGIVVSRYISKPGSWRSTFGSDVIVMSATKGMLSPLIVGVDARVIGGDGASDLCGWMIESGAGTAPLMPKLRFSLPSTNSRLAGLLPVPRSSRSRIDLAFGVTSMNLVPRLTVFRPSSLSRSAAVAFLLFFSDEYIVCFDEEAPDD